MMLIVHAPTCVFLTDPDTPARVCTCGAIEAAKALLDGAPATASVTLPALPCVACGTAYGAEGLRDAAEAYRAACAAEDRAFGTPFSPRARSQRAAAENALLAAALAAPPAAPAPVVECICGHALTEHGTDRTEGCRRCVCFQFADVVLRIERATPTPDGAR